MEPTIRAQYRWSSGRTSATSARNCSRARPNSAGMVASVIGATVTPGSLPRWGHVRLRWPRPRRVLSVLGLLVLLFALVAIVDGWAAFGTAPAGARAQRVQASPQWGDGIFHNPEPLWNDVWGMLTGYFD